MKKIITILFITVGAAGSAQDKDGHKGYDPTNWFTGGSVSVSLGGYDRGFAAGLNPHFGYRIARWIDVALAVDFQYSTARDVYNNKYRSTTIAPGMFTRIYPVSFLLYRHSLNIIL